MFVMAKNKELFASTLNGITASVRCVSSMIIVLNAKDREKRKSPRTVPFFASLNA